VEKVSGGVDVHVRGLYRHQADSPTRCPSLPPVRCGVSRGLENLTGTQVFFKLLPLLLLALPLYASRFSARRLTRRVVYAAFGDRLATFGI
jgi:hypothetical protein